MPVKSTTTNQESETTKAPAKKASSVQEYYYGTGKRKSAIAKVRLYKNGKGVRLGHRQRHAGFGTLSPSSRHRRGKAVFNR